MGGHGSGRKPDPSKQFIPERANIAQSAGLAPYEIPNLSPIKKADDRIFLNYSSGSGLVRTDADGVLTGGHPTPSAAPGGSDTEVQFNDGGSFGGDEKFTFNKTTGKVEISGSALVSGSLTVGTAIGDQVLAFHSSDSTKPAYAFQSDPNTGMDIFTGDQLEFITGGSRIIIVTGNGMQVNVTGSQGTPAYSWVLDANTGMSADSDTLMISAGAKEFITLVETTQDVLVFNQDGSDIDLRIETDDEPNFFFIDGNDNTLRIGDMDTNYMQVSVAGDVTFVGGAGLVFGAMYNDNTSTTVTIASGSVFVRIPSGFLAGQLNGVTFANARELTVTEPGMYKIDWSISFNTASGSNQEIEGAIGIDNTKNAQGTAHRFIGTVTDIGNMGGTAILDLADNAVVSLMMANNTNTVNIVVTHASLSLVQVGGT